MIKTVSIDGLPVITRPEYEQKREEIRAALIQHHYEQQELEFMRQLMLMVMEDNINLRRQLNVHRKHI